MNRGYVDDQYYHEPCNCCGKFGHWAQDCPGNNDQRYNQQWDGPDFQNHQQDYNHIYNPGGQQIGHKELDDIRSQIEKLTSLVEMIMQQQKRQAQDHDGLVNTTTKMVEFLNVVVANVENLSKSSNSIQVDQTPQLASPQNPKSEQTEPSIFETPLEVPIIKQSSPQKSEEVVKSVEHDPDQNLSSQIKIESESFEKPLKNSLPTAFIGVVSTERDPTQDERWEKFEKRKINLSFLNIIKEDPDNVECLKGLTTLKRKHKCPDKIDLSADVNKVLLGAQPLEFQDPSPGISIQLGELKIDKALLDLGLRVNILPGSLYDQYDFGPLQKVQTTVLADQTFNRPRGIVKDVIVKVGELYYPIDFLVLESVENTKPTVILGRPFLATTNATVNFAEGTMRIRFGSEKMNIKIFSNSCNLNSNKYEIPEKVNHIKDQNCVEENRVETTEIKEKGNKRRSRKRKWKRQKPEVGVTEKELFTVFVQAFLEYDEQRNEIMRKEYKHPTRPP